MMLPSHFKQYIVQNIPNLLIALLLTFIVKELFSLRKQLSSIQSEDRQRVNDASQVVAPQTKQELLPLPEPEPALQSLDAAQIPPAEFASASTDASKKSMNARQRAFMLLSIGIMAVLIGTAFYYSFSTYTTITSNLGQARADQLIQTSTATPKTTIVQPQFERGIIYPRWQSTAYGTLDTVWQLTMETIKTQTGSQWVEMPVLFSQATASSTDIQPSQSTPTLQSFTEGVQRAHSLGYKVFFVPLMQVRQPVAWSGSITFSDPARELTWFNNYWLTIQPYVKIAASEHVEQMAIGTELQTLQINAPASSWNQLIDHVRSIFTDRLTYDMNWSSLSTTMPTWLNNPALSYIGVSSYIPLVDTPTRIDPAAMPALWQAKVKTQLDSLSIQLNKPILISEIGYRNSTDALYHTWEVTSKAPADPLEQAGAYDAALSNVLNDPHIAGTFFWGWDDVGMFSIKNQPATQILLKWYTLTHS